MIEQYLFAYKQLTCYRFIVTFKYIYIYIYIIYIYNFIEKQLFYNCNIKGYSTVTHTKYIYIVQLKIESRKLTTIIITHLIKQVILQ